MIREKTTVQMIQNILDGTTAPSVAHKLSVGSVGGQYEPVYFKDGVPVPAGKKYTHFFTYAQESGGKVFFALDMHTATPLTDDTFGAAVVSEITTYLAVANAETRDIPASGFYALSGEAIFVFAVSVAAGEAGAYPITAYGYHMGGSAVSFELTGGNISDWVKS